MLEVLREREGSHAERAEYSQQMFHGRLLIMMMMMMMKAPSFEWTPDCSHTAEDRLTAHLVHERERERETLLREKDVLY